MPKGTVKRLISDRGFGFIPSVQGAGLFLHFRELQGVEFELGRARDGRSQAVKVKITQPGGQ